MTVKRNTLKQGGGMLLNGSSDRLIAEIDIFFDGSTSEKIKALNHALNAFVNEGRETNFADKNYVPNTVFNITSIVDFLSSCSELWEHAKRTGFQGSSKQSK